jgi:hypothetical protein
MRAGPCGAPLLLGCAARGIIVIVNACGRLKFSAAGGLVGTSSPLLTYWYFHLPNFVLAALMYTLLGRALLGLIVAPDSSNFIWRFFCRITDPFIALIAPVTPKAVAPVVLWLFGVFCSGCASACSIFSCCWAQSPRRAEHLRDRTFYYIGIAFFGVINGLFNQTWLLFALIHAQILSPALLFGSVGLTLMFASLMVSTATITLGGLPAAIYERWIGAKEDSNRGVALGLARRHRHPDASRDGELLRHTPLIASIRVPASNTCL